MEFSLRRLGQVCSFLGIFFVKIYWLESEINFLHIFNMGKLFKIFVISRSTEIVITSIFWLRILRIYVQYFVN